MSSHPELEAKQKNAEPYSAEELAELREQFVPISALRADRFLVTIETKDEALRRAREALPDYAHPSLDAKRSDQIARVGVILDAALGDEDAQAALASLEK